MDAANQPQRSFLIHSPPPPFVTRFSIGSVLCPASAPIALSNHVVAQVLVFNPSLPLVQGTSLELYQHSASITATLVELVATLDKSSATWTAARNDRHDLYTHSSICSVI